MDNILRLHGILGKKMETVVMVRISGCSVFGVEGLWCSGFRMLGLGSRVLGGLGVSGNGVEP